MHQHARTFSLWYTLVFFMRHFGVETSFLKVREYESLARKEQISQEIIIWAKRFSDTFTIFILRNIAILTKLYLNRVCVLSCRALILSIPEQRRNQLRLLHFYTPAIYLWQVLMQFHQEIQYVLNTTELHGAKKNLILDWGTERILRMM